MVKYIKAFKFFSMWICKTLNYTVTLTMYDQIAIYILKEKKKKQ